MNLEEIKQLRDNASMGPYLVEPFGENWSVVTGTGKRVAVTRREDDARLFAASLDMISHIEDYDEQLDEAFRKLDGLDDLECIDDAIEAAQARDRTKMRHVAGRIEKLFATMGSEMNEISALLREEP